MFKEKEISLDSITRNQVVQRTNIVELIGPPGIGKSAIYKALCESRKKNATWTTQDFLFQPGKPHISNTKKWLEYQLRSFFKRRELQSPSADQGLTFMENHTKLVKFLWQHLSDNERYAESEIGLRFRASYFLFKDFCRYQQIWSKRHASPCIIEEGFLQKSFLIPHNHYNDKKIMSEYLSLLPRPQAVIYVNTNDTCVILERLLKRNKIIASHKGKSRQALQSDIESWQQGFRIILEKARQDFQIPVFYLNGADSIPENVRRINHIMNNISKSF